MGQQIVIESELVGDVAVFTGDRSLTGQDPESYRTAPEAAEAAESDNIGAILATRLFDLDDAIDYVYVQSNNVMVRRTVGWDDIARDETQAVVESLFIHYDGDWREEAPVGADGSSGLLLVDSGDARSVSHGGLDSGTVAELRATHYNATITAIQRTHETLWIFDVEPDEELAPFAAGQYATLALGYWEERIEGGRENVPPETVRKLVRRSYSISSSVLDGEGQLFDITTKRPLEFYVVLVEKDFDETPALLTPRLFIKDVGDRIYLGRKIAGRYRLDKFDDPETDVIMLATGTGEAPHNFMTLELLHSGHKGRIVSACTVRNKRDLAYLDIQRTLEERYENYTYLPMTTREPENEGKKIYTQEMVKSGMLEEALGHSLDSETTHFYLCGNPAMIGLPEWDGDRPEFPEREGVAEVLTARGFTVDHRGVEGNVHYEEYW